MRDEARVVTFANIGQRERQIGEILRQLAADRGEDLLFAGRCRRARGEFAHRAQAAFVQDAVGFLDHHAKHAGDRPVIVEQRAVGEGMIGFFRKAAALEEQQHAFRIGRLAGPQHLVDHRADLRPDLFPYAPRRLADRPGEFHAERRAIGIVAEEGQVGPPRHPHLVARSEHHADDRAEACRPSFRRADGSIAPVMLAHQSADFPRADQKVGLFILPGQPAPPSMLGATTCRIEIGFISPTARYPDGALVKRRV